MTEDFSVNEREEPAPTDEQEELFQIINKTLEMYRPLKIMPPAEQIVDDILEAGYSKSRSPAVEVDYLLAEEVIQRAVQGLDFAEDAQTIILPVKRCELEGVQMVAYIDGPTLEDLLCKSLDVERYRVVPAGRSPAEVPPTDSARLDWLDAERCAITAAHAHFDVWHDDREGDGSSLLGSGSTIREAIDAAMGSDAVWRSAQPHD
jgi:hypothetical protein